LQAGTGEMCVASDVAADNDTPGGGCQSARPVVVVRLRLHLHLQRGWAKANSPIY